MKIKEISYRRVRNLGNYETEAIEVVAVVDEEDSEVLTYARLKTFALKALGYRVKTGDIREEVYENFGMEEKLKEESMEEKAMEDEYDDDEYDDDEFNDNDNDNDYDDEYDDDEYDDDEFDDEFDEGEEE